jgi:hypothetical protein
MKARGPRPVWDSQKTALTLESFVDDDDEDDDDDDDYDDDDNNNLFTPHPFNNNIRSFH